MGVWGRQRRLLQSRAWGVLSSQKCDQGNPCRAVRLEEAGRRGHSPRCQKRAVTKDFQKEGPSPICSSKRPSSGSVEKGRERGLGLGKLEEPCGAGDSGQVAGGREEVERARSLQIAVQPLSRAGFKKRLKCYVMLELGGVLVTI